MMADIHTSLYVTKLSAETEALSLHVTTKCVMSSSNSLGKPSPLTAYATNPSSTMVAAEYRKGYIVVGEDWRQDVKFSFGVYGNPD